MRSRFGNRSYSGSGNSRFGDRSYSGSGTSRFGDRSYRGSGTSRFGNRSYRGSVEVAIRRSLLPWQRDFAIRQRDFAIRRSLLQWQRDFAIRRSLLQSRDFAGDRSYSRDGRFVYNTLPRDLVGREIRGHGDFQHFKVIRILQHFVFDVGRLIPNISRFEPESRRCLPR